MVEIDLAGRPVGSTVRLMCECRPLYGGVLAHLLHTSVKSSVLLTRWGLACRVGGNVSWTLFVDPVPKYNTSILSL